MSYHGGMFGLSTANVIQLAAMKTNIIKSNQSFEVSTLQNCLILKVNDILTDQKKRN